MLCLTEINLLYFYLPRTSSYAKFLIDTSPLPECNMKISSAISDDIALFEVGWGPCQDELRIASLKQKRKATKKMADHL